MDIQVGDKVTYRYESEENIRMSIITDTNELRDYKHMSLKKGKIDSIDILKIERIGEKGWYTVYEAEKELLTEEEREYLKLRLKFSRYENSYIKKEF